MATFAQGTYVFLPDEEEVYLAAKVESGFVAGKSGVVSLVGSGRKVKLGKEDTLNLVAMDEESLEPTTDMVNLKQLNEASILHNLRARFERDQIYTSIGSILVSINPFKVLPIYSPEIVDKYIRNGSRGMPPHVYGVADDAFRSMVDEGRGQSCIVSGESGAGKTEATKLFLQYLSEKSSGRQGAKAGGGETGASRQLQEQILEANPLLEAFGNAKTVRNDNSSRFGKLIEVHFDNKKGSIVGGSITSYLLEKSRLVQQAENERNYHIFYQLCAAAGVDPELNAKYDLEEADQYFFLNQSEEEAATVVAGINDLNEWNNTVTAMEVMGITATERDAIVRTLAGILHLGNLSFSGSDEKSSVANSDTLARCADQLGMTPAALEKALCMRNRGNAKEAVFANQGVAQARNSRDALAKAIYSLLFDWLIEEKINAALAHAIDRMPEEDRSTIGVLDIFGFESFRHNSFEQLCINYCNEKLQGHFNEHIFMLEQKEYAREGIDVSAIAFEDNGAVLAVLESKSTGIFSILDEENRLPRGSDSGFLSKVLAKADGQLVRGADLKSQRAKESSSHQFAVAHYAGEVSYDSRGFLVKNKDLLLADLASLGAHSSFAFVARLFQSSSRGSGKGSGKGAARRGATDPNKKSIGTQFKEQLQTLMQTLGATEPHFVRCIKPNTEKQGNLFSAPMCLDQLRCAGLLEVCRIRRTGFPVRRTFAEFEQRYRPLAPASSSLKSLLAALEKRGDLRAGEYQKGKAKVFLRQSEANQLETARDKALHRNAVMLQALARGFVARRRYQGIKAFRARLAKAMRGRDAAALAKALLGAGVLPFQGRYLAEVQEAKRLLDKLREEQRVLEMLEEATAARDKSAIQSALKAASDIGMEGSALVKNAEALLASIEREKATAKDLRAATASRDLDALAKALKAAEKLKMQASPDYKDAAALRAKLEEAASAIKSMSTALKKKDLATIRSLLPKMAELGLETHEVTVQAENLAKAEAKRSAEAEEKMAGLLRRLEGAIDRRDMPALEALSLEAIELGLKGPAVEKAKQMRQELQGKADAVSNLTAQMRALEIRSKSHEGIDEKDVKALSEAIQSASDAGMASTEEEMSEAMSFEERMHEQIQVQAEIKEALRLKTDDALAKVMRKVQQLGLETGGAREVIAEVRARTADKATSGTNGTVRGAAKPMEQLREASEEELLEDAARRILTGAKIREHEDRVREAGDNNLYDFKKFFRIRSDEDYTENLEDGLKAEAAQLKLRYQTKAIAKSLLDLDADLSKKAVQNHKALLQYCGELSNSFPVAMAGYVVVRGQEHPELADEIYLQLLKQLTENPREISLERAWGLLCICARSFPCSADFEPFVFNFLLGFRSQGGSEGNFARLALLLLDGTINMGPSPFLPSMDAIEAYGSRPPLLAEINRPDGAILYVPVEPSQDVGFVLELCCQELGLLDEMDMFSIFVIDGKPRLEMDLHTRLTRFYKRWNPAKLAHVDYFCSTWSGNDEQLFATLEKKYGPEPEPDEDLDREPVAPSGEQPDSGLRLGGRKRGKRASRSFLRLPVTAARSAAKMLGLRSDATTAVPSPESPWPLPWWAFLGDVFLRMVKQGREPIFTLKRMVIMPSDPLTPELFAQIREDVRDGDLPIPDNADMAKLVAIDIRIKNNGKATLKLKGISIQDAVVELLPKSAMEVKPASEWEAAVRDVGKLPTSVPALQSLYVETCRRSPVFAMSFFYAQRYESDKPVVLGVSPAGLHIVSANRQAIEETLPFQQIAKFGASGTFFWVLVVGQGKSGGNTVYYRTVTPWSIYSAVYTITHVVAAQRNQGQ